MGAELILGMVVASALLFTLLLLLVRRTVVATIAGFFWQRKVVLEQYIWVRESSYSGYPKGSRNRHSELESTFSYGITGYTSTTTYDANGTPTTTIEPVYGLVPHQQMKYTYEIQRWRKSRELLAEGDKRTGVHWPYYTLDAQRHERVGRTHEKYQVFFQTAKGKRYTCELPEKEWAALDEQRAYRLWVTLLGRVTRFAPDPAHVLRDDASGDASSSGNAS